MIQQKPIQTVMKIFFAQQRAFMVNGDSTNLPKQGAETMDAISKLKEYLE